MRCLNCGNECQDGWSTCSQDCTAASFLKTDTASTDEASATEDLYDVAPAGIRLVESGEVARKLHVANYVIHNWIATGRLTRGKSYFKLGKRMLRFDLEAVAAERNTVIEPDQVVGVATEDSVSCDDGTGHHIVKVQLTGAEIGSMLQVESIRSRGLAAAKEAFRDELLAAADEAKLNGDHRLQARLLEDYVHFEEGLKLIYEGKAR